MPVIPFSFNNQTIEFELNPKNLKVNATQMAKAFGKDVPDFTMLKNTKDFINECLNNQNSGYLGIEKESDLIESVQQKGTWMHKVLALKFTAWLNPAFELWIYMTLEKLIFAEYENHRKSLQETAKRRLKMEELKERLKDNEEFIALEELRDEDRKAIYGRTKMNQNQIKIFRDIEKEYLND